MSRPTIGINSTAVLNFDATGGTTEFYITYTNSSEECINTPLLGNFSDTITVDSVSAWDDALNSVVIKYTLTVGPQNYQRVIPMVFSCMNPDNGYVTTIVKNYVVGTLTEEEDGNGAYIVFDNNILQFDATGGTLSFMADGLYPSDNTDDSLSIRVMNHNGIYPIQWCSTELNGGDISQDGTSFSERWSVIMNENEFTEPRIAVLICSYTNAYGDSASNTVYAIQNAANGEAVDATPYIQPYVTVVRPTSAASSDYLNVMYHYISEDEISNPYINVSWLTITATSVVSITSSGVLMRYYYDCEANTGAARTATITYSATVNNTTVTASTTFTQAKKAEEAEDDPDIPVEDGVYLGQIWRDVEYNFGSVEKVNYELYQNDVLIFKGRSMIRPNDTSNKIMVNKIVQNYMQHTYLLNNYVSAGYALVPFYLKAEGVLLKTYYFVNDWSYSDDFNTGVLSHQILSDNKVYRGQWMPFTVFAYNESLSIPYGVRYQNGTTDEYGNAVDDWESTAYISSYRVETDYFLKTRNEYVENIDTVYIGDNEYKMVDDCKVKYMVYYVNPWGGYDWLPIKGRVIKTDNITPYTYTKNYNNTTLEFGKNRYLAEINRSFQLNTHWLSEEESSKMWYLLESNIVYLHNLESGELMPVIIKDTTVEHKERTILSSRIKYTINVELSQTLERL